MNQALRRVLFLVVVVVGGFLAFKLFDLLTVWWLYSWFFQAIRNASGMPDTLNGAFSIWLVTITLMLLPTFLSVVFWKRDPKKVLLVVSAVSVWLVIVYFMSLPKEGRFFNPMTGQAMYRYSLTPEGKIELFPVGYKFHPRYGDVLQPVTPELIKEMDQKAEEAKALEERVRLQKIEEEKAEREKERREKEVTLQLAQTEQEILQQKVLAQEQEKREKATQEIQRQAEEEEIKIKMEEKEIREENERKRKIVEQEQQKQNELNTVHLRVTVNRNQAPFQALVSTFRKHDTLPAVVEYMPHGEGKEVVVSFFKLNHTVGYSELEEEYKSRGLKHADPYSVAAVNEAYPAFSDDHPNTTQWTDSNNNWCIAAFGALLSNPGERILSVRFRHKAWEQGWWFAGIRK